MNNLAAALLFFAFFSFSYNQSILTSSIQSHLGIPSYSYFAPIFHSKKKFPTIGNDFTLLPFSTPRKSFRQLEMILLCSHFPLQEKVSDNWK